MHVALSGRARLWAVLTGAAWLALAVPAFAQPASYGPPSRYFLMQPVA